MIKTIFFLLKLISINCLFNTENGYIKDEYNRTRLFHGINRIKKQGNYYYDNMLNMTESNLIANYGFNVVRLQWMWNAFEPLPNQYNMTYFNQIEKIINNLGKNNIYTILDSHQDELADYHCSEYGLPLWVINKSYPTHNFPWPLKGTCDSRKWYENVLSEAIAQGWQDFYDNENGMLDDFIRYWQKSTILFKNNPYILGFEIINEPFIGNFYKNPLLFAPGIAGSTNLMKFYDKISDGIRKYDYNRILFYEPITWGMIYKNNIFGPGLNHVPGKIYTNTSIYSYHYYCSAFVLNSENRYILRKYICDDYLLPHVFENTISHIEKVGGSSFLTEFGLCLNKDINSECGYVLDNVDKYFQSWTDYTYAQVDNLSFNKNWTDIFSRSYPIATAGTPIKLYYNTTTKQLKYCFNIDLSINKSTEIYFTELKKLNISTNLNYSINKNILNLYNLEEGIGCVEIN